MFQNNILITIYSKSIIKTCPVIFILLAAATVLVLPHYLKGFPVGHSIMFNVYWQQHFTEQFLAGDFYPRWLLNYQEGLGTPVFYFYGPMPYYLLTAIEMIFGSDGEGFRTLTIGHMLIFFLSGVSFHILISRYTDKFWAILLAILYMIIPYHYIDIERRAALGESLAYVWIPLVISGLWNKEKTWNQLFLAGICYGGLILSHIPSAMLFVPAIAIFSFFSGQKINVFASAGRAIFVGITGAALSAIYLMPAMTMQDTLPPDAWVTTVGREYQATQWLLGVSSLPSFGVMAYIAIAISSLIGIFFTLSYIVINKKTGQNTKSTKTRWNLIFACNIIILGCWFLMSIFSKPIWENISTLSKVQFPWRLGTVVDFCSVFLISLTAPHIFNNLFSKRLIRIKRHIVVRAIILSCFFGLCAYGLILGYFPKTVKSQIGVNELPEIQPCFDTTQILAVWPREYRPKWLIESDIYLAGNKIEDLSDIDIAPTLHDDSKIIWCKFAEPLEPIASLRELGTDESVVIDMRKTGDSFIEANLEAPATIRVKRLYYPHWKLTGSAGQEIEVYPDKQSGLLVFDLPEGKYKLTLGQRLLGPEKAGIVISLVSLIGILICICTFGRHKINEKVNN
ncbi:MAG: hypothetical protein JEZ07_03570 [Phycisphaerae bacterium]|nr:hypothetical protein [Phycisphaerae bacterium]